MGPVLAVDLPVEPRSAEANRAILAACDEALRPRRCATPGSDPARVRVRWSAEATVEIDDWDGGRWRHQTLSFTAADDEQERWRAVGLVVAAVASGGPPQGPGEASAKRATTGRTRSPFPPSIELAALGLAGPGAARGAWRTGGSVAVAARARTLPLGLRACVCGTFGETQDAGVDVRWLCAAGGPFAAYEPVPALRLSLGTDIGWEWLSAILTDTGERESRGYATARPWAAASFRLAPWLGVRAGVEVPLTPGQAVRVEGRSVGRNPGVGVLAVGGLEFRPAE